VLGIDPGTASTGFGLVERRGSALSALSGGVISTTPDEPLELRLAAISARLDALIAEHRPAAVAVEDIFFGRNVRTAFAVGQARGVVLAAAGAAGVPCFPYTPQAVKLAVCGSGRAGKEQVQRMVAALLGLEAPPESDHAADALALAICHSNQSNWPL
jgi:crossover junction endodeoxyribonuclease RuvC